MGKIRTTKKAILNAYPKNNIIAIGYCNAHYLLGGKEPIYYTAGANGWGCDCYLFNDVLISTGYAPINGNLKFDYKTLRKYEDKAKKITYDNSINYEQQLKSINKLLNKFIKEVKLKYILENENNE